MKVMKVVHGSRGSGMTEVVHGSRGSRGSAW